MKRWLSPKPVVVQLWDNLWNQTENESLIVLWILVHSSLHNCLKSATLEDFPTCLTSSKVTQILTVTRPHTDSGLCLKTIQRWTCCYGISVLLQWLSSFRSWTDGRIFSDRGQNLWLHQLQRVVSYFSFPLGWLKSGCGFDSELCIIVLSLQPSLTNRRSLTRWTQLLWLVWEQSRSRSFLQVLKDNICTLIFLLLSLDRMWIKVHLTILTITLLCSAGRNHKYVFSCCCL